MQTPFVHSELRDEFEEPIAIWNASSAIRFGAVLVLAEFIWSLIAPTEPPSLILTSVDVFFGGLSMIGFVILFTGLVEQANWGTNNQASRFWWLPQLPRLQCETRVFGRCRPVSSPQRPTGYHAPREMATGSMTKRLVIAFIWTMPLLWILPQAWLAITTVWGTPSISEPNWLLLVGVGVVATVVHEAIHALVAVLYGCGVSAGVVLPLIAYIRPSGAFLSRRARILSKLAPTIVITLVVIPILFYAEGWLMTAALWALLLNTVGAVDDFRGAWQLLKAPSKRLYYAFPNRDRPTLVYDHLSQQNAVTLLERCERVVERLTTPLKIEQDATTRYSR
jgi:hypothetical protein